MPCLTNRVLKYCRYWASVHAIVTIQGRGHYLEPWKSKASRQQMIELDLSRTYINKPSVPIHHLWRIPYVITASDNCPAQDRVGLARFLSH